MSPTAIRFHETGGPDVLRLEQAEVSEPGPGQARVRHVAIGVNFADVYFRSGVYPVPLPSGIGVEASGVVAAVGPGVTAFAVGDRVTYTGSPLGAYSTERTMPVDSLIHLPEAIGHDQAAAMTMRGLTSGYLLRSIWPLEPGNTVLFHAAAGGVGLIFCQWATLLGIEVIGTAGSPTKAELARTHGCAHVIDLSAIDSADDVVTAVKDLTGGRGVKVVYDGVGRDTYDVSRRCLARRGLLVCLGTASGPFPPIDATELLPRSLFVTRPAAADYLADPGEKAQLVDELFGHVAAGRIRIQIGHRYHLGQAAEAHRDLEARATFGSSILDLTLDPTVDPAVDPTVDATVDPTVDSALDPAIGRAGRSA